VAMVRAMESRRSDRLFRDPYAAAFVAAARAVFDPAERGTAACLSGLSSTGAGFWSQVVIRTRFFDDHLLHATGQGVGQVVLLAAGLDTRAYRLAWAPGVRLFELDLAEVLEFKRRVLAGRAAVPRCGLHLVSADLREDWAAPLIAAGLRPDQPTAWLLEGLLIYLSADEVVHLLTRVGELSAAGSRVAFESEDTDADTFREQARRLHGMAEYVALWKGGLPDAPGWLAAHGWELQTHRRAEITAGYGRTFTGSSGGGFVTATRV
jgi:methyltransferase (TIGR00027 family)